MNTFNDWLLREAEKADLSFAEIARRGKISHARISQVLGGESPGYEFCVGIARGLKISREIVFRRAGLLSPKPAEDEITEELLLLYSHLPPSVQDDLLEIVRALELKHAPRANHCNL